jgi:ABC-2 type transport system ATP-binding protein
MNLFSKNKQSRRTAVGSADKADACILFVKGLSKRYAPKGDFAIEDISFSCRRGEIVGLLGANGAGKSTTLKCVTGMLNPTSGKVSVCGYDLQKQPVEAKSNFSFVTDNHAVFEKLTGLRYLAFMADVYGVESAVRTQRTEYLQQIFRLGDDINRLIASYSHGMKQKICMMGSLMHMPKLWILDEPMVGLDPNTQAVVLDFMQNYAKQGNTVLFSTHNMDVAEKLCHRKIIIDKGRLVGDYPVVRDAEFSFLPEDFSAAGAACAHPSEE